MGTIPSCFDENAKAWPREMVRRQLEKMLDAGMDEEDIIRYLCEYRRNKKDSIVCKAVK